MRDLYPSVSPTYAGEEFHFAPKKKRRNFGQENSPIIQEGGPPSFLRIEKEKKISFGSSSGTLQTRLIGFWERQHLGAVLREESGKQEGVGISPALGKRSAECIRVFSLSGRNLPTSMANYSINIVYAYVGVDRIMIVDSV